ncbi:MAG: DUF308 domain-containing protein [Clostridiaceae bacterium]|nr:DUF308 domain-containing protein [Clostridiaceae bacterium]
MELIKKAKRGYIAVSIVMILLGALIAVFPTISAITLCYIIGALLIALGITKLMGYFSKDMYRLAFQFDLAMGIFLISAGSIIMLHPANVVSSVPVIIGVFAVIDGAFRLQMSFDAKRFGIERWRTIFLLGVLTGISGLFLVTNPFEGAEALMILMGVTLIVDGIQNLCVAIYTVRASGGSDL